MSLKVGRYNIEENDIYALVQEYDTTPIDDRFFENHKYYTDLQYVVKGKESIYFASNNNHYKIKEKYDEENDAELYFVDGDITKCILKDGDFVILYPGEYHIPQCKVNNISKVSKIVIKIKT